MYNIFDFGAKPGTAGLSTVAIQNAIDAAHRKGGGTVLVPPGEYLTGTLHLRSGVNLHLEFGATLTGSGDYADYRGVNGRTFLIGAIDCAHVAITGGGTIHGNGPKFWKLDQVRPKEFARYPRYAPMEQRPFALLHFRKSTNILIENVTLRNAACYTVWPLGCDDVVIHGITIDNDRLGPNNDGVDLDCSSNVRISDCNISCGDDALCLKSDSAELGADKACENITVTNCVLASACCAIRIGYEGDAPIRNCVFSNLVFRDSRSGIVIDVVTRKVANGFVNVDIKHGARIENLVFANIVMDVQKAIHCWVGIDRDGSSELSGYIRNVLITDVVATIDRGCYIGGHPKAIIDGLELRNVKLIARGDKTEECLEAVPYPRNVWGVWETRGLPYPIYCRYVKNLTLRDVTVVWADVKGSWSSALRIEDAEQVVINGLRAREGLPGKDFPVIRLTDVRSACITGAVVAPGGGTFLQVEGAASRNILVENNDLRQAAGILKAGGQTSRSSVCLGRNACVDKS